jgi:hypothetical protein
MSTEACKMCNVIKGNGVAWGGRVLLVRPFWTIFSLFGLLRVVATIENEL